jgi:PHP family Zn ribbon phosphoesterase
MLYDLHLHTAVSPCADDDMTPANIVGMMSLNGADVIAVTDHNTARNLPAAKKAADFYNIKLLPGIEVNTAEDIHVLCYFKTLQAAVEMGEVIYDSLPKIFIDEFEQISQPVMNAEGEVINSVDKLLWLASGYDIYQVKEIVSTLGGIAVPAHVDRSSNSLISVLGSAPVDLKLEVIEMMDESRYKEYLDAGLLPAQLQIIENSDSHSLAQLLNRPPRNLNANNPLMRLIENIH